MLDRENFFVYDNEPRDARRAGLEPLRYRVQYGTPASAPPGPRRRCGVLHAFVFISDKAPPLQDSCFSRMAHALSCASSLLRKTGGRARTHASRPLAPRPADSQTQ